MPYHKKKLGEKLGLPTFNHYYNIPITSLEYNLKNLNPSDTYIITFKQDNNLFVVDISLVIPAILIPSPSLNKTSSYQVSLLSLWPLFIAYKSCLFQTSYTLWTLVSV